jgi:hypothetical protein
VRTCTDGVAQRTCKVSDLSHVDTDVWIEGAGCDSEGVPLVTADVRAIKEEPLAGLVGHAGLSELYLHDIWEDRCKYN